MQRTQIPEFHLKPTCFAKLEVRSHSGLIIVNKQKPVEHLQLSLHSVPLNELKSITMLLFHITLYQTL